MCINSFSEKLKTLQSIAIDISHPMSCNFASEHHFHSTASDLIMKPLMLAKDEPADCDHVSESNYVDNLQQALSFKSNANVDIESDNEVYLFKFYVDRKIILFNEQVQNEVSAINRHHDLVHHLRSNLKLENALMEYNNEGLNLINKPNMNDDNNNTNSNFNSSATTSNDNNNNNTNNMVKSDGVNKVARKLFECDVCNVRIFFYLLIF